MENTEDIQREKDIQKLCIGVLNASPASYYNPNGSDWSTCPFCHNNVYFIDADIEQISHTQDCAYLIAKDLSTNNNKLKWNSL